MWGLIANITFSAIRGARDAEVRYDLSGSKRDRGFC